MINVTKTYLPEREKLLKYIDQIYKTGWVTNNGPLVQELQNRLQEYLGVKNILLVSNGTVALEVAYKLLKLEGEVITTPFSFVATTNSLIDASLNPKFVDIDPKTFNMDPEKIEAAITTKTSAIVPVHVFGNVCEVEKINDIAKKNDLKVIYDAAHAFNVQYKGSSVLNSGDIATLSFHATKIFHTIEGGALIIKDDDLFQKAKDHINFGIRSQTSIVSPGINAKMNEFEAAMGLCVLDEMNELNKKRKYLYSKYENQLQKRVMYQARNKDATNNYSYFPILLNSEHRLLNLVKKLNENDIYPRRYFYPSLDSLEYIQPAQLCRTSRNIAEKILCLPLFPELKEDEQDLIIEIIKKNINQ